MGLEKFGYKSFVCDVKGDEFVDGLDQGRVTTTKCRKCGKVIFPPRHSCPECWSEELDWIEVKGNGRLVTFTTVRYGPAGFENMVPYILGVVEFPSGLKMFGQVKRDPEGGKIKVGARMKVVAVHTAEHMVAYEFQEVHEGRNGD